MAMTKHEPYKNRIELLQGTLDMLILQVLERGANHGHAIAKSIQSRSEELLKVETGSLYPALHRLAGKDWIDSEWKITDKNQRAKYYKLTRKGRKQLTKEQDRWALMVRAIGNVMKPEVS